MQSGRIKKLFVQGESLGEPSGESPSKSPGDPLARLRENAENHHEILVVGEVSKWQALGRVLPKSPGICFAEFHELDRDFLEIHSPDTILSPVLCVSFDCLDLAMRLDELGFRGRYRAMSGQLPGPWLIRREIADICPELDFDIVDLANATGHRLN